MSIELHPCSGEMRVKSALSEEMVFEKLEELEFDSFRKCMSVVVRDDATGIVHVVAKGAETAILPKGESINDVLTKGAQGGFTGSQLTQKKI